MAGQGGRVLGSARATAGKIALVGARLVDPEAGEPRPETLLLDAGVLVDRLAPDASPGADWIRVELPGLLVAPGFIDLHFHGELAVARPGAFARVLERAAERMLSAGTTAFLATSLAWSRESLGPSVAALCQAIAGEPGVGAGCLGLHLEGPWINPLAPGALAVDCIRPFEPHADGPILDAAGGLLRMVTLAPEMEGAAALLEELASRDVLAALGHTRASSAEIEEGVTRGLRHVTHLFNAMGPLHHREPGVPGTVLACDAVSCDLICDGFHVHPSMVRVAARALRDRLVLITDRVDLEEPDPTHEGDGAPVRLANGTLAGSQLTLDRAVRNVQEFAGLELCEAVAAGTLRPARLLGIENERGTLRRGARADLAVLEPGGRVVETWLDGRRVWNARDATA